MGATSNFLGDLSAKGLKQAYGLMANYCYDVHDIENNHEAYAEKGEVIASASIRRLRKGSVK